MLNKLSDQQYVYNKLKRQAMDGSDATKVQQLDQFHSQRIKSVQQADEGDEEYRP